MGIEFSFDNAPRRIISLAPNITESIYAVGADSSLVGITDYCDYPPQTKDKKKVGGMINPDIEVIINLKPDLIFLTTEGNSKATYQNLINLGYKVFTFNPRNTDGITEMINKIGIITCKTIKSQEIINNIKRQSDSLKLISSKEPVKTCFIVISLIPLITVNGSTFINEVVKSCNLKNIYSGELNPYPEVSYEDLASKIPDYMIFPADLNDTGKINSSLEVLKEKLNLNNVYVKDRVLKVDENLIMRPGPRIIQCECNLFNLLLK